MRARAVIALLLFALPAVLAGQHTFLEEHERVLQRQRWFVQQRAFPFDAVPAGRVHAALTALQQRGKSGQPSVQSYSWEPLGTTTTAGRMTSIAVHPTNPNVWIAGSGGGGVWKTVNRGTTWQRLPSYNFPVYAVGCVAFHPDNPNELYAGTGEPNFASFTYPGNGVMRSLDGGETWTPLGTASLKGSIAEISIHPDNPDLLFAACAGFGDAPGIYRSADRGATWESVLAGASGMDIAVHPVLRNIVYAALSYPLGTLDNGVYRSLDTGRTWTKLVGSLPAAPGRIAIAVTPAAPDRLYTLISQTDGRLEGLFVSTDRGDSFSRIDQLPSDALGYQGWYNIALAVSPFSTADLTVGGVGLYRSANGGLSWTELDVHVDQHALVYLTSDSVLIANDGGMYTARGMQTATRNAGLTTTQYYDIGILDSAKVFGGTQDNGSHVLFRGNWRTTELGGDVMQAVVHPGIGGVMFAAAPYGLIFKSTTDGDTWFSSTSGIDYSRPAAWKAPLVLSRTPGQSSTLFTATTRVYRTTDLGTSWQEISGDLASAFHPITAIAQARTDASLVVAAAQNGKVFYTRTGGTLWNDVSAGLPERYATAVAVHPSNKRFFIATFSGYGSGHVWRSIDQGATWIDVSGNLPDIPVNCFAFDPVLPDSKWYIGTDFGVYYTLNAGVTWLPLTRGLGIAPVADIEIAEESRQVYIATFGMGIFRARIDLLPVELAGFSARLRGGDVLLNWETASERNNAWFEVERSATGDDFERIGRVEGHGNSAVVRHYSFIDRTAPPADRLLYRLVQVDVDGTSRLLPTVEVAMQSALFLEPAPAPNPFRGTTTVRYRLDRTSPVTMAVYSSLGVRIRRLFDNVHHNSGAFSVEWDGRDDAGNTMPPGVYLLRLETGGTSTTIPVVKQ